MKSATINAGQFTLHTGVNEGFASIDFAIYSDNCHKRNHPEKASRKLSIFLTLLGFIELCSGDHRTHRYSHYTGRLIRNAAQQRYEYRGTLWFYPLK